MFITKTGNKNEELLVVVIAWDLPELDMMGKHNPGIKPLSQRIQHKQTH